MLRRNDFLDDATNERLQIVASLSRYSELDMGEHTCPVGMVCDGITQATELRPVAVYRHLDWLVDKGFVRIIGKRHPLCKRASNKPLQVYVVTERGRAALRSIVTTEQAGKTK